MEKGDESVALGIYAAVLFVLGLADPAADTLGQSIEERNPPVRVRLRGSKPPARKAAGNG